MKKIGVIFKIFPHLWFVLRRDIEINKTRKILLFKKNLRGKGYLTLLGSPHKVYKHSMAAHK